MLSSTISRDPSRWPAVRRRFILAATFAIASFVGTGAAVGWITGGTRGVVVGGGVLLLFLAVALGVAYSSLRQKYLGSR